MRIKFLCFDGDLRKYPKFKSDLLKFILPAYKKDQAAFVLKSYLEGTVNDEVESLDDLQEIWTRLDRKYGDESKHIDAIMAEIKEIPICDDIDVKGILNLILHLKRQTEISK